MLYSFIIPVYNCKDYLEACVQSICNAQISDYEILLIDDGSTDGSSELCDMLGKCFSKVRVIHQKNAGVSAARNTGIHNAKGEYFLFVDSDDMLQSEMLSELLCVFPETKTDLAVFGISFDYYKNQACYGSDTVVYNQSGVQAKTQWLNNLFEMYSSNVLSSSCTKIFKREIIVGNHLLFDMKMCIYEDLEFVLSYLAYCEKIYFDPRAIYRYRQAEDEGNAGRRLKKIENLSDLVRKIEHAANNMLYAQKSRDAAIPIQIDYMILQLYIVVAREKIAVSDLNGIRKICVHFSEWYIGKCFTDRCEYIQNNQIFVNRLLKQQILPLWLRKNYTALRHRVAVVIKNTAWYQKKKGASREC